MNEKKKKGNDKHEGSIQTCLPAMCWVLSASSINPPAASNGIIISSFVKFIKFVAHKSDGIVLFLIQKGIPM